MKKIIVAAFLFIPFSSWAQNNEDSLISLKRRDYTIQYPLTWTIDTSKRIPMADLFIISPKDFALDNFSENVNVIIQDLSNQPMSLDEYMELNETQIKNLATNVKFIENERLTQNGIAFHKLIFTSQQGIFELTTEQYYFIYKNKAFVLTLTTEEKRYSSYKVIGESILNSFRFND